MQITEMQPTRTWFIANNETNNLIFMSNPNTPRKSLELEEAFLEDAKGPFGGFTWPPRSYNCDFCGREFRSAQSLGGHMNIHKRDRARLKRSLSRKNDDNLDHQLARTGCFVGSESYCPSSFSLDLVVGLGSDRKEVSCKKKRSVTSQICLPSSFPYSSGSYDLHRQVRNKVITPVATDHELDLELRLA